MKYKFLKRNFIVEAVLGYVILVFGLYAFFLGSIIGILFISLGLVLVKQEGTEIDINKGTFRKIYDILFISIGTWKPLPNIDYISVFKTTENTRARFTTAEALIRRKIYKVNAFYGENKHLTIFITKNKGEAIRVGHEISKSLNKKLLDATTANQKWL